MYAAKLYWKEWGPLGEPVIVLFCLIDDLYAGLNPYRGRYASLERLSVFEVL